MVLKAEVVQAFEALGLTPDVSQSAASTAYKKLALKHHPDRNYGDSSANERFQEIGHAWTICQRHFEHPYMSQEPDPKAKGKRPAYEPFADRHFSTEDDVPMDDFEADLFFQFMFEEMMKNRFTDAQGRTYRRQRRGDGGGGIYAFSGGFAESQKAQEDNTKRQRKEREEYLQRVREFEREQAEEQAEINRIAREERKKEERTASAQERAFQLGRDGKGAEMRRIIEEFDLDVTKPQKLRVSKKDPKAKVEAKTNFETMLHVAAGSCGEDLVQFLIGRGADPAALNSSNLAPFHFAISRGNTPVVRYFLLLLRNTRATDPLYQGLSNGCHPSKAINGKGGRTPLQLAIASGSAEMVGLLLKEATVHDVEKCWTLVGQGESLSAKVIGQIKEVLLTKNGFVAPEEKKAALLRQQEEEAARTREAEKRKDDEKARRLAEEEENRQRKKERAEKAARELEAKRAAQEAEQRKVRQKEERAERQRRADAEARAQWEAEERARREFVAAEEERRKEAAREARRVQREMEAAARQAKREAAARQRAEAEAARRAEATRQAQLVAERERQEEESRQAEAIRARQEAEARIEKERKRLRAEAKAAERARVEEEIRFREEQEEERRVQQQKEMEQAQLEAKMRRRAEQSARDKARNQRLREKEKTKAVELTNTPASQVAPTRGAPTANTRRNITPAPLSASSRAQSRGPPPIPLHTRPKIANPSDYVHTMPLSPPMTPEDLQTCAIPEDLFRYESPPSAVIVVTTPSSPASTLTSSRGRGQGLRGRGRGRGQGRGGINRDDSVVEASSSVSDTDDSSHQGNGIPCRFYRRGACARGTQCAFSHVSRARGGGAGPRVPRTALENELAKKELEIERMRAELAAARAGGVMNAFS